MVMLSFRFSKKKTLLFVGVFLFAVVAALFGGRLVDSVRQTSSQSKVKTEKIAGDTEEQRQSFLDSFGWQVEKEPSTIIEIKIPEEFDKTYEEYNNLQKTQQMDLSPYKGKRCKKYQYAVLNYPDRPEHVVCTLLTYNGRIVGGDISALGEDGFTHGFARPIS